MNNSADENVVYYHLHYEVWAKYMAEYVYQTGFSDILISYIKNLSKEERELQARRWRIVDHEKDEERRRVIN